MSFLNLWAAPTSENLGLAAGLTAFGTWGLLPIYFDSIDPHVSGWEILLHRIIWAVVMLGIFAVVAGYRARVRETLANRRLLSALLGTAALIAVNWATFVWAVVHHHVVEASLGYYINPLLNVALGFGLLGERLRRAQWLAVALATAGVLLMTVGYGRIPWVALLLAGSFASYGLVRKRLPVDSITGLLIETLLLSPIALVWLGLLYARGTAGFLEIGAGTDFMIIGLGVVTVVPFVLFVIAVQRLHLGTVGLIQYLTPTLQFLSGIFLFGEPLTFAQLITFGCIWTALIIYSADALRAHSQYA